MPHIEPESKSLAAGAAPDCRFAPAQAEGQAQRAMC